VGLGVVGVLVTAVQGVEVAGLVSGVDGHAGEAGLFEVVDAGAEETVDPGW
jgi:hypothetical protein